MHAKDADNDNENEKENDNVYARANEIRFAQNLSFLAKNVENFVENFKKHSKIKGLRCGKICGKHVENSEIYLF